MRTIGIVATVVASGGVVVLAASITASIPDIARYLRMRRM
jgi:hypothetical protein